MSRTHPTVAAWCRALAEFPGGEDGFRDRLLHEALATKLKSPAVAGFHPGILEQARDKLSGRPRLMAVWDKWVAGRGYLRELLRARLSDPAAVRAEIRAVRNAGLDPDLPPPAPPASWASGPALTILRHSGHGISPHAWRRCRRAACARASHFSPLPASESGGAKIPQEAAG